jgi:hypothetical protein
MTDFVPNDQILIMLKQEFVNIAPNINESITWDDGGMCRLSYNLINPKSSFWF